MTKFSENQGKDSLELQGKALFSWVHVLPFLYPPFRYPIES